MKDPIIISLGLLSMMLLACSTPKDLEVVQQVDIKKYQGTWYEIARFPNSFEKKLERVSATYTIRDDGKIDVYNKGFLIDEPTKEKNIKGVAWVPDAQSPAKLKVRFFWPFAGDYWILALDKDYRYALVGDPSRKYLWILGREKTLDDSIIKQLSEIAKEKGFDVSRLSKVKQML